MVSGGEREDDGVLLTIGFDGRREQSYLLLLDARTFSPLNTADLPHNIPSSVHGMHFPEAKLDTQTLTERDSVAREEL